MFLQARYLLLNLEGERKLGKKDRDMTEGGVSEAKWLIDSIASSIRGMQIRLGKD